MMNSDKIKKILIIALISVAVIGVILGIVIICTTLKKGGQDDEEHYFVETQVAPTCTEQGYTLNACACGFGYKTDYIPALGHDYKQVSARAATCELVGYNNHQACTRCDSKLGYTEQPALGHIWNEGEITLEATCEVDGNRVNKCVRSGCGLVQDFVIPASGHVWDEITERTVEPTCETAGEKHFICHKDNATKDEMLDALGHDWDDKYTVEEATCVQSGRKYIVCLRDGSHMTDEELLPLKAHSGGSEVFDDHDRDKHYRVCQNLNNGVVCGQKIYENHYYYDIYNNDANGHYQTCQVCNHKTDKVPHTPVWTFDELTHKQACSVCHFKTTTDLPHSFEEDECTDCHYNTWTKGLIFGSFNADKKTCAVTGIGKASGNIKIPKIYEKDGITYTVTEIAESAFGGITNLLSITTYSTLSKIGVNAFKGCTQMRSISFGGNIESIGESAFEGCTRLEKVDFNGNIKNIGKKAFFSCSAISSVSFYGMEEYFGEDAFSGCSNLQKVDIKIIGNWCAATFENENANPLSNGAKLYVNNTECKSLNLTAEKINDYAFTGCSSFAQQLTFDSSVKQIGKYAFSFCRNLKTVQFPTTLESLGECAFRNCGLTALELSVKEISGYAFTNCEKLSELTLTEGVEKIGKGSFAGCKVLTNISITNTNLTQIGADAFKDCGNNTTDQKQVHISDVDKWCTVVFVNESANPLSIGANLYENTSTNSYKNFSDDDVAGITSISNYAFCGCTSFESVALNNATKVGKSAFKNCSGLKKITITVSNIQIGEDAFSGIHEGTTTHVIMNDIVQWCSISFTNEEANPLHVGARLYTEKDTLSSHEYKKFDSTGITAIKDYAFVGCSSLTQVISEINIGKKAFANCEGISYVYLNEDKNITSIGESAFEACTKIARLYIYDLDSWSQITFANQYSNPAWSGGVTLYKNKETVTGTKTFTEIDLSASTNTDIKAYAFYGWDSITIVKISDNLKTIGESAFGLCDKIEELHVQSYEAWLQVELKNADSNPRKKDCKLFVGNTEVNDLDLSSTNLTEIADYAFSGICGVKTIILPATVTKIGKDAFKDCTDLEEVYSLANVTEIGEGAFAGCTSLKSAVFSEDLTTIPANVFNGCTSLETFHIGNKITWIGDDAFKGCSGITSINVDSLKTWYKIEFGNSYSNPLASNNASLLIKNGNTWSNNFSSVSFDADVTKIPDYTFRNSGVTAVTIPKTVTKIGDYAFSDCSNLQTITFEPLTARVGSRLDIGDYAFKGCTKLETLNLESVKSIGEEAFKDCTELVTVEISNAETFGASVFSGCYRLTTLTIPFVGATANSETASATTLFGYIFGSSNFSYSYKVVQKFSEDSGSAKAYFIPWYLVNVTVLGGVIRYGAFFSCSYISTLTIGEGVTLIENCAFALCHGLTTVNFNAVNCSNFSNSNNEAFYKAGPEITDENKEAGLEIAVTIGAKVERIPSFIFCHTDTLITKVTFNTDGLGKSSCKTIGANAFFHVPYLTEIVIPDSVTKIGISAFESCESLTSLTIGEGVTSIGDRAFKNCTKLEKIYFRAINYNAAFNSNSDETAFSGVSPRGSDGLILKIGSSVTCIPDNFLCCSSVKYILFDANTSLSHVGTDTIGQGANGFTIYYTGTRKAWGDIANSVVLIWDNNNVRYYSEDEPSDSRFVKYWHYDVDGETPIKWQ